MKLPKLDIKIELAKTVKVRKGVDPQILEAVGNSKEDIIESYKNGVSIHRITKAIQASYEPYFIPSQRPNGDMKKPTVRANHVQKVLSEADVY